jgi:hypothetical protein
MTWSYIINIILGILAVAASFIGYYFYIRGKLLNAATGAVNDAEQDGKIAAEKRQQAVDQVYALVPALLKPILSKTFVADRVQEAFEKIEQYAKKQLAKPKKE